MVSALRRALTQKALPRLNPTEITQTLDTVMVKNQVVYSKTWLDNPDTAIRRHYGFLSNRTRREKLGIIRQCLQTLPHEQSKTEMDSDRKPAVCRCPKCKKASF